MDAKNTESESEVSTSEFVKLYMERNGKAPSISDMRKLIELEHQKKHPFLYAQRLHVGFPSLVTFSIVLLFFFLSIELVSENGATKGVQSISVFLNSLPDGVWGLLQLIFGFWFGGKAGTEMIKTWTDGRNT